MKVGVLGASGSVGTLLAEEVLTRGHVLRAQSRNIERLKVLNGRAETVAFDPTDAEALSRFCEGLDAVIFALGESQSGPTTLFSEVTSKLLPAMEAAGASRLIAITGVGAGETRGHGGFLYDRIIYPLFTRHRYADKDRQEALIAKSPLDWVIVRPAPFAAQTPASELQVLTEIPKATHLTKITRAEVARFVADQLGDDTYLRQRPFIGHA